MSNTKSHVHVLVLQNLSLVDPALSVCCFGTIWSGHVVGVSILLLILLSDHVSFESTALLLCAWDTLATSLSLGLRVLRYYSRCIQIYAMHQVGSVMHETGNKALSPCCTDDLLAWDASQNRFSSKFQ